MLHTKAECQHFLESQSPSSIAELLRLDQQRCRNHQLPSILALYLPSSSSELGDAISRHVCTDGIPASLRHLQYEAIIKGIKAYLHQFERIANDEPALAASQLEPTTEDLQATVKVLDYLRKHETSTHISMTSSLSDILATVDAHLGIDSSLRAAYHSTVSGGLRTSRRCYICRHLLLPSDAHHLYASLCRPCGTFNLSASELSVPSHLNLFGKTVLVTGGRINLGFHTARRLLRCGANVIVSSRYPRDAELRFSRQHDFDEWSPRLRVVGADFRTAKDAFQLVTTVKRLLQEWTNSKLDILINNAAQTLTDSIKSEVKAITREEDLREEVGKNSISSRRVLDSNHPYEPKVRGGMLASWAGLEGPMTKLEIDNGVSNPDANSSAESKINAKQKGLSGSAEETMGKSSWVQTANEIPYEDIISAFSVNSFVPLILCRELLPLMGNEMSIGTTTVRPLGYIINVSSREGIFEDGKGKREYHVHTNMSKAAINMITETEAGAAWKRRVAMNSVDPGYMSAAPEFQSEGGCPIGFEDGAARIMWPIAIGEQKDGMIIRGRFLKHFGAVGATIRRG